jgi:hypothetical protein
MQYIIHTRLKEKVICGKVNLPATTICELSGNMIMYEGKPICIVTSQVSHEHFTRNDDGQGLLRGSLIKAIQRCLTKRDVNYQNRWDKVWDDSLCQKYKRKEHQDFWLWNHDFFNASIEDLKYIANLIGIKETSL